MKSIICVTGATGSIGQMLTFRLLKEGYKVRAIVRNENKASRLKNAGAEIVLADFKSPDSIIGAFDKCSVVYHTAGKLLGSNSWDFWETNVFGTSLVITEALRANINRFVHISSVAVYGYPNKKDVIEDHPWHQSSDSYIQTKQLSESMIWNRFKSLPFTIIRPGEVIGPNQGVWTNRILHLLKVGLLYPPQQSGCLNPVYIDNLIDAVLLLGSHPSAVGQAFNVVDGYTLETSYFIKNLAKIVDRFVFNLPIGILKTATVILEHYAQIMDSEPIITSSSVEYLLHQTTFLNNKARDIVGWSPAVNFETAITNIEEWYKYFKDHQVV
jgi:nucleoside-diphosphate-sugar epimerase